MSLIDPLSCGFAKVAAFNILSTKLDLPRDEGEKSNEYKGKVLKVKYSQYITYFNEIDTFTVEYRQFGQSFKQIIPNIKGLEKRYRHKKQEILTFSKNEWDSLSYEVKKRHSLTDCDGCMKNLVYRKTLAKFPVNDKRLQQKATKNGLYRDSVLADITNLVVKKLDQTFKETFNETFSSQLKPYTKQLKEIKRETVHSKKLFSPCFFWCQHDFKNYIYSTSGKARRVYSDSTYTQRSEHGWLKYLLGIRGDLQGQERTHKYQMHFIKSDRHFQKICIQANTRNDPNVCFTLALFFWLSTCLYFYLFCSEATYCSKKNCEAHTLMLLMKIKTCTRSLARLFSEAQENSVK